MAALFLKIVNMSITAGWLVIAVLLVRLLLKKAPKFITCIMWGLVGIRLVCPFSIESVLSLVPSKQTLPDKILTGPSFDVNTGIGYVDKSVNDYLGDRYFEGVTVPTDNGADVMTVLACVWLTGIALMLIYTLVSCVRIRKRIKESVILRDNIYLCDRIESPFIFGVVRPKIYLQSAMSERDIEYVIAHEKAHLKRCDHLWKPLGFLILAVYWFNPLIWLSYILLCRDIELACDQKVIKEMGNDIKKPYSEALINCSLPRKFISACPLAFGETGVKGRIKSVLNYKKPAFWVVILGVLVCLVTAVCFLTNPKENKVTPNYGVVGSTNGGNTDKAQLTLTEINTTDENPYIKAEFKNNYDDILCYGEEICLFRDEKELEKSEGYGWDTILNTIPPQGNGKITCYLSGFDISKPGNYRMEKEFYFEKTPDEKHRVYISFIVGKRYSVAGKTYVGQKIVLNNTATSFENIPEYTVTDNMHLLITQTTDDGAKSHTDLGQLMEIKLENDFLSEHSAVSDWTEGYSAEALLKNNKTAFAVTNAQEQYRYYVLEQKNGDVFICQGTLDLVHHIFKMTEEKKIDSSSPQETGGDNTTNENQNPYFNATVLEVYENSVWVEPFPDEEERKSGEIISVGLDVLSKNPVPALKKGDKIRVVYNGEMLMVYPVVIDKVFAIYRLNDDQSVEYHKSLISFGIDSVDLLKKERFTTDKFTVAEKITKSNTLSELEAFLNTKYCEEKSEGNWVKFNPGRPNDYALAIHLENGSVMLLNIHFAPSTDSVYYFAVANIKGNFDISKDYSDLEYTRYVADERFGEFLKSIIG